MYRKLLSVIVTAALAISLAACGDTTVPSTVSETGSSVSKEESNVSVNIEDTTTEVTSDESTGEISEEETFSAAEIIANAAPGDEITFGSYEQDADTSNGAEPIEWIVVKEENGKKLLISKYALMGTMFDYSEDLFIADDTFPDYITYTSTFYVNWDEMPIRSYLNGEFYDSAFTAEEAALIVETENSTSADIYDANYNLISEEAVVTTDKVFLLGDDELTGWINQDDYMISKEMVASATAASGVTNESIDSSYYMTYFDWSDADWEANKENYPCGDFCLCMWRGSATIQNADGSYRELIYVSSQYGEASSWYNLGEITHRHAGKIGVRPAVWVTTE